jgi:xanthine dehydrogenase YagR molybdenum-binding subunit
MQEKNKLTGTPVSRIDGILKVTGKADYSTDHPVKNVAYAVLFKSTITAGTILDIDTSAAEKSPGVLTVITHKNAPKLNVKGAFVGVRCCKVPLSNFTDSI